MRRLLVGSCLCVLVGVMVLASTAAASSNPVKHCGGRVTAERYGVTVAGGRIHVIASAYGPRSARRVWPVMSCPGILGVVHDYLAAKLYRPLNRCTVPAEKGYWCHVDHWLCATTHAYLSGSSPEQVCEHVLLNSAGNLRRWTRIFFHETDYDHA